MSTTASCSADRHRLDPLVLRGLDAFVYSLYSDARLIVAGTPSGVTLAPEAALTSRLSPRRSASSCPVSCSPSQATPREVDWLQCDGRARLMADDGESLSLRLSTRPLDQGPVRRAIERAGEDALRAAVLGGAYHLIEPRDDGRPAVDLIVSGAVVPEAVAAATELDAEGVDTSVVVVTSAVRLYRGWQSTVRSATVGATTDVRPAHLEDLLGRRSAPIVSAHDASAHPLAWISSAVGAPQIPLGVERFGESGRSQTVRPDRHQRGAHGQRGAAGGGPGVVPTDVRLHHVMRYAGRTATR